MPALMRKFRSARPNAQWSREASSAPSGIALQSKLRYAEGDGIVPGRGGHRPRRGTESDNSRRARQPSPSGWDVFLARAVLGASNHRRSPMSNGLERDG